jgi:hypothetical protein
MGTGLGLGIGIPFRRMGAGIDAQAQAHFNRVIADGGLVPSGLVGVNNFFKTVKGIYGTSDITTAISVGLDAQVLGYKLGAGAGTTAGQAAQKLYSCSGSSGDVVQTTAASQPLLLVHSGANYWFQPSISAANINRCSTDTINGRLSSDIDIKVYCKFSSSTAQNFIGRYDQTPFSWLFFQNTSRLNIALNNNTISASSTINNPLINSEGWVRVTRNGTNGDIMFYTSTDTHTTQINSISWTQLGSTISAANTPITTTGTDLLSVGYSAGNSGAFNNKIFRIYVSNTINATPIIDFNPNQYNAATSQTQWTSSTGEVWSIQTGTAKTGFKGVLVDRTILQSNGIATSLRAASINVISQAFTLYNSFKKFNNTLGTETIFELGTGATSSQGINLLINSFAGFESSNIFANVGRYNNNFSNNSLLLGLRANIFNINNTNEAKPYLFNNVVIAETGSSASNNNTAAVNATAINLLATNSGSTNFSQINFNTTILSLSENNTTILTAMYNYIRSINGNSF